MELREALTQVSEIHKQLARTEVFRGFRAVPVAFSALLALAAACFQTVWIPEPESQPAIYLILWLGTALVSIFAAGSEMAWRYYQSDSSLARRLTWLAVEQFLPSIAVGAGLTLLLAVRFPDLLWLLPGLWQIFFSLGILASFRLLPRATLGVALFYLFAGFLSLFLSQGELALSPWLMGVPFGLGQLYAAAVLYWTLERNYESS